ncbi:uncharacterized protein PHA67_000996 [Liasis olivaceus]
MRLSHVAVVLGASALAFAAGSLLNFKLMIQRVTQKNALIYFNGYGCFCGKGGRGKPRDNTDMRPKVPPGEVPAPSSFCSLPGAQRRGKCPSPPSLSRQRWQTLACFSGQACESRTVSARIFLLGHRVAFHGLERNGPEKCQGDLGG